MAEKSEKKILLRNQINQAAQVYAQELAGKVFLYVFHGEYFEIVFKKESFLHLTGVDTFLHAADFYKKAKNGRLNEKQFYFSSKHPFAVAKKKLPCLIRLPELTNTMVCIVKDMSTITFMYNVGVTNLEFTLGVTENVDSAGNKVDDLYIPRSLRVNDDSIDISRDGDVVDFIFARNAADKMYDQLMFRDETKTIPESVFHLLDEKFKEE